MAEKIGVSVYQEEQLSVQSWDGSTSTWCNCRSTCSISAGIQSGQLEELSAAGIEVHARSAFLQGVLLATPSRLPEPLEPLRSRLERYHQFRLEHHLTAVKAALAFVLGTPVDCVLIGAARADEFAAVLEAAAGAAGTNFRTSVRLPATISVTSIQLGGPPNGPPE